MSSETKKKPKQTQSLTIPAYQQSDDRNREQHMKKTLQYTKGHHPKITHHKNKQKPCFFSVTTCSFFVKTWFFK